MLQANQTMEILSSPPYPCPNCDKANPNSASIFCSELCNQEAQFVRYFRARRAEGRDRDPDIKETLEIKLAVILGGGYPAKKREVSDSTRKTVIAREKGLCFLCGKPGSDVDHIDGSSSSLDNLQYLCRVCHNEKTRSRFRKITPETHPEEWAKREMLLTRVQCSQPMRICDQSDWDKLWHKILAAKKNPAQGSLFL